LVLISFFAKIAEACIVISRLQRLTLTRLAL
jgi:hypothetical protein